MSLESETGFTTPDTRYEKLRHQASQFANDHILLVLMGPALLIITAIFVYPVFYLLRQSLYLTLPGAVERFVGLDNFVTMFQSSEFWDYFVNTLIYSFGSLVISLGSGLVIALAINHVAHSRLRDAYSTLLMFSLGHPAGRRCPHLEVDVHRQRARVLQHGDDGPRTDSVPIAWLSTPQFAMLAVTLTDAWARMPFAMLLLLAGLQSIPEHMYDAAKVDGATTFQTFRAITVQYLRPYIAIVALINWMFAFRAFAVVFPMTAGGPGTSTTIFSIHIYREGMINFNYGYASAVAVFIIAITLVVATFYVTKIMGGMEDQWLCRRNVRTDQLREATGILGPRREPKVIHFVLALAVLTVIVPIFWEVLTSLKTNEAVYNLNYFPRDPTLSSYYQVLIGESYWKAVVNSIIISTSTTIAVIVLAVPAGYAFSRYRFRGDNILFIGCCSHACSRRSALIVPYYQIMSWLGLLNSFPGSSSPRSTCGCR